MLFSFSSDFNTNDEHKPILKDPRHKYEPGDDEHFEIQVPLEIMKVEW